MATGAVSPIISAVVCIGLIGYVGCFITEKITGKKGFLFGALAAALLSIIAVFIAAMVPNAFQS
ncbi:MAG: hypothetical protein ACETWD_07955 [Desulfatiglandales bacterium]